MSTTTKFSRREFLRFTALSGAGVVVAACTQVTPTPQAGETAVPAAPSATAAAAVATEATGATTAGVSARGFVEPPFLAERVAAGKLPPIDERMPVDTFVVGPGVLIQEEYGTWQNGQYGGDIDIAATWGTGFLNIAQSSTVLRSPSQSTKASRPNVVSKLDTSDDLLPILYAQGPAVVRWRAGDH